MTRFSRPSPSLLPVRGQQLEVVKASLVPRPPLFLPSVCVHNNTWEQKTSEKRGKPESSHHVSGREVDVGREGPIFKYVHTKLESKFLTGQDE